MYENEKSNIGEKTSQLMSEYFIIKSLGTLIPSYFKGFLIAKYSNDIIFYISGIISFLILISDLILVEEKNIEKNEERVSSSSLLDNEEKEKEKNMKILVNIQTSMLLQALKI